MAENEINRMWRIRSALSVARLGTRVLLDALDTLEEEITTLWLERDNERSPTGPATPLNDHPGSEAQNAS